MAAEENRFVTYIIPPFPVQERILRNKTWQDFSEIWLRLVALVGYEMIIANSALRAPVGYLSSHIQRALLE